LKHKTNEPIGVDNVRFSAFCTINEAVANAAMNHAVLLDERPIGIGARVGHDG
jgi:hypothetical protein